MGVPLQTYVGNVYMSLRPCIEIRAALIVFNFIDGCVIVPIYGNEISSVKTVNGECGRVLKSMYANKCTSEWPCLYDYS